MKKIIKQLGFLMILLSVSFVFRIDVKAADSDYKYTVNDGKATITGYKGEGGNITIPSTFGVYPVTTIGEEAFMDDSSITGVTIPGTIKTIEQFAFYGATNLKEVIIEDGCKEILCNAFRTCFNLEKVVIPASITNFEYRDNYNYIFGALHNLTAYIEPESAAQTYFDTYEKDIPYYYFEEHIPTVSFTGITNNEITISVGESYIVRKSDITIDAKNVSAFEINYFSPSDSYVSVEEVTGGWKLTGIEEGVTKKNAGISDNHFSKDRLGIYASTPLTVTVVEKRKKVESVSLNVEDVVYMYVGDTLQLNPTVTPSDATYTSEWGTTNSSVANVSGTGLVTALKKGTSQVGYDTRSVFGNVYDNNGKYILIEVKERPLQKVESITVNVPDNMELYIGDTIQVTPTISPENAVYTASWSSTNSNTASVSDTGFITALNEGLTQVIFYTETKDANTNEWNRKVISIRVKKRDTSTPTNPYTPVIPDNPTTPETPTTPVTPTNPVTPATPVTPQNPQTPEIKKEGKISLNASKINLQKGKTIRTLELKVNQLEGDRIISVTSSNKKVLKASLNDQTIILKGSKAYKKYVTVTVIMQSGATADCKVKVVNNAIDTKRLTVDKKITMQKGEKQKIEVARNPISATDKIFYRSSNTKVATVDKNGKIKAKKKGKTTITISSSNGKKATCKVTVK